MSHNFCTRLMKKDIPQTRRGRGSVITQSPLWKEVTKVLAEEKLSPYEAIEISAQELGLEKMGVKPPKNLVFSILHAIHKALAEFDRTDLDVITRSNRVFLVGRPDGLKKAVAVPIR